MILKILEWSKKETNQQQKKIKQLFVKSSCIFSKSEKQPAVLITFF